MVVLSVLMLTSCLFLYVLALVGTILMVKGVYKVSVEMVSTMVGALVVVLSMPAISRVSKTCSIVMSNSIEGWCLCGLHSNFL